MDKQVRWISAITIILGIIGFSVTFYNTVVLRNYEIIAVE